MPLIPKLGKGKVINMKSEQNNVTSFRNGSAFYAFMREAMEVESLFLRKGGRGHKETLCLQVDESTGHIITWHSKRDPAPFLTGVGAKNNTACIKIPWQIRGV